MKVLGAVMRIVGLVWVTLVALILIAGLVGIWIGEEGFSGVQRVMSPFNVVGHLMHALFFAPGILMLIGADKLRRRAAKTAPSPRPSAP